MKNVKIYFAFVAVFAMMFTSCSKDNQDTEGPVAVEVGELSLSALLEQYSSQNRQQENSANPPSCDMEDVKPAFVRAAIKDPDGNWIDDGVATNGYYVDIPVIPISSDSDADGAENFLTYEAHFLELEEGTYELVRFSVLNASKTEILLAPSSDDTYGPANFANFVENALPIDIFVEAGTKTYQEIEVLCYDEAIASEYGYLFFDFEEVPLTYICIFGNECDEYGKHTPSHFRVKVWEYPALPGEGDVVFTDENALVDGTNDFNNGENEGEVTQADPLCIPLPDRDGENWFYGEIYTIDENGIEKLIRRGDFSDEDTKDEAFGGIDDKKNYWHFREGDYCGEDSDPCLLSRFVDSEEEATMTFGPDLNDIQGLGDLETDYIDVDTDDDGLYYQDNDQPAVGAPAPFGGYLITNNPQNYYGPFVGLQAGDDGNMIVFDGSPDKSDRVLYTLRTSELCAGDTYFLKMRVKDISAPDVNNARLRVIYRAGSPETATLAGNFEIDPLVKDADGNWSTVGFIMTATEDGSMLIRIRDREDDNTGNDFAMDDIVLSNDPTVLNGVANINPSN